MSKPKYEPLTEAQRDYVRDQGFNPAFPDEWSLRVALHIIADQGSTKAIESLEAKHAKPKCEVCGEPMPAGEEMFKFHGYSGDCPKPPLPKPTVDLKTHPIVVAAREEADRFFAKDATFDKASFIDGARFAVRAATKTGAE